MNISKPGTLAIVTRGIYSGSVVECLKYIGPADGVCTSDGLWAHTLDAWAVTSPKLVRDYPGRNLLCPDAILRPVSGLDLDDETQAVEPMAEVTC